VPSPSAGSLGLDGRAARMDRDSWLLSLDPVPKEALAFARTWGSWAWENEQWEEAAEAYAGAAIALSRIVLRDTQGIPARLALLAEYNEVSPRSAFAYARAGRKQDAVIALERAAHLFAVLGSDRQDLEHLAELGRSDLRDRVLAAQRSVREQTGAPNAYGHFPVARQQAQGRLDAIVNEIRAVPGMERFATHAGWPDAKEVAQFLAIAYLAATSKGTVVLTVARGDAHIDAASLPITQSDIWSGVLDFFTAEFEAGSAGPGDALVAAQECLDGVMRPVAEALGDHMPVVLVPLGLLAQLPLHAAAVSRPIGDSGQIALKFTINPARITYATSARSWLLCRQRAALERASGALVINNPAPLPVHLDELPLADFERDVVARYFSVTELAGRDATDDRILGALPDVAVAHFCCHGTIDNRINYTGVLHVADYHLLTVLHLRDSPPLKARLVVLSACTSGMSATGVTQMMSMPAAFVTAGAAAVIATFWHTDEMATLLLVTRFYLLWQRDPALPLSFALGQAQEWLATSPASQLRSAVTAAALASPAARRLVEARDEDRPYIHPWFWTPFFLLGA
jgi:CHAT domain-containing protein